ncbi:AbrB/MazE/SpoVT family DNA-binding domain-containing protein [Granulicella arctica]|jgi:antitoxin component of MazEF toxin-antitoxin module|uniref:Antitoxin component of MazEF toxin-antitoxin module n=1 Tax=Granulicella arctica TaxID=940613 RepID=A0A7Y9PEP5_9BACT|nr:AbrB/MazE/SpoVT family DNA-binding domain-containing protein [Granulicella arctica]NYF78533.1 antitoxin component of MazEF toxin-antitoxin module [Granulicella arctica]
MELKIRKIGNGYGVLFPKQLLEEMRVTENSVLQVEKIDGVYQIHPHDPEFAAALRAFRETEPAHRNSYRELAK